VPPGSEFAWEEAERKLQVQLQHAESLDSKATTLLGFVAIAFGLLGTSLDELRGWGRAVGIVSVLGLGLSAFLLLGAFWVRRYDRSPDPEVIWRFAERDKQWIQHRLLTTRWDALRLNDGVLGRKAAWLKWGMRTLAIVGVAVIVAAIIKLG
jgi:hypothetical protein